MFNVRMLYTDELQRFRDRSEDVAASFRATFGVEARVHKHRLSRPSRIDDAPYEKVQGPGTVVVVRSRDEILVTRTVDKCVTESVNFVGRVAGRGAAVVLHCELRAETEALEELGFLGSGESSGRQARPSPPTTPPRRHAQVRLSSPLFYTLSDSYSRSSCIKLACGVDGTQRRTDRTRKSIQHTNLSSIKYLAMRTFNLEAAGAHCFRDLANEPCGALAESDPERSQLPSFNDSRCARCCSEYPARRSPLLARLSARSARASASSSGSTPTTRKRTWDTNPPANQASLLTIEMRPGGLYCEKDAGSPRLSGR